VHGEFLFEQRHPQNYRGAIDPPPDYVHVTSIADALQMAKRLTLHAASDEHDGHPGNGRSRQRGCRLSGRRRPAFRLAPRLGGADFYLVRVVGRNGRAAYAGPIWVEAAGDRER